jgi:hypothetical protein
MANPSARAPRAPVTIDVTNPENPDQETIQAPPDDVVKVYNRHVGRVAGIQPMTEGRVRRHVLDRYPWALRAV